MKNTIDDETKIIRSSYADRNSKRNHNFASLNNTKDERTSYFSNDEEVERFFKEYHYGVDLDK